MKTLKTIWAWLNGKKNIIANFYWTSSGLLIAVWVPGGLSPTAQKFYTTIGIILGFIGLGHSAVKKMFPRDENNA